MLEQFSDDLQNQLMDMVMQKRKAWSPRRFKKFPRFTIFLNKHNGGAAYEDGDDPKDYLKENIISLNPDFMNLLLNANTSTGNAESAVQQIENALASINYPAAKRSKS